MSARVTYTLKHDMTRDVIEADGAVREEAVRVKGTDLFVRRMRGGDLEVTDQGSSDAVMSFDLIARLTGLKIEEVKLLDVEDMIGVSEVIANFLPAGLRAKLSATS